MNARDLESLVGSMNSANLAALDRILQTCRLAPVPIELLKRCFRVRDLLNQALSEVSLVDGIK